MFFPQITASNTPDSGPVPKIAKEELGSTLERYYVGIIEWVTTNQLELLVAFISGLIIFLLLTLGKKLALRWSNKAPDTNSIRAILARAVSKTSRFFRIMVSMQLVAAAANTPGFLERIIAFLFTISAVIQTAIWAREIILGFIERRAGEGSNQETLQNALTLIRLLVSFVIFAIAAIVILDNVGVDVTGLIAGLGVGGIAIGLAAQGIFSDLFAAMSIIFDKPFKRGDVITYDQTTGFVEKIGMKSTRIRALTGEEVIISNTQLLDKEIINVTGLEYRRTAFNIGVIYQTPADKAREIPAILQEIVEAEDAKFVRSGFIGFGDSALNFELLFDMDASHDFMAVFGARHRIGLAIVEAFGAHGYEFAYPTQTTFTAAPDGRMVLPYPDAKAVRGTK